MTPLEAVPAEIEGVLDPVWLTRNLNDLAEGDKVIEAALVENKTTVASKLLFEVSVVDGAGNRSVRNYCAKGCFGESSQSIMQEMEGIEVLSYLSFPEVGVRMPRVAYAGTDPESGRSLLVLDDIVKGGSTLLNVFTTWSRQTIEGTLGELAKLHAATWGNSMTTWYPWIPPGTGAHRPFPLDYLQTLLDDGRGPDLPSYLHDASTVSKALQLVAARPKVCAVHGDPHSGNAYLDAQGRAGWYDWQCVHQGEWAADVGYHIASSLDTDTRRRDEQDLLGFYLESLGRLGVEPLAWTEAWDAYRTCLPYGYWMWAITNIHWRPVTLEHIPRLGMAVVDHDSFGRLGAH